MKLPIFEAIVRALHDAGVQYLVVGAVAVNAHGYIRFTSNIDLALALNLDNIRKAFQALATLNYYPTRPINAEALAYPKRHQHGSAAPETQLLSFLSKDRELTPVNLPTQYAFDFTREYDQAMRSEILPGIQVRFLSISALIRMKESADHPQDRIDIEHLRWLEEDHSHIDETDEDFLWNLASFEGARKMQIIQAKKLPVRKRLESLDGLGEVCEHFRNLRRGSMLRKWN